MQNGDARPSSTSTTASPTTTATTTTTRGRRQRLSEVVSDCVRRWFQDTLKEAKGGDVNMQVLVSQMYNCGYGVPQDVQKGRQWMTKASRIRSSAWRVSEKRPGYNASDSDSEELIDEAN